MLTILTAIGLGTGALGWIFGFGSILKLVVSIAAPIIEALMRALLWVAKTLFLRFWKEVRSFTDVFPIVIFTGLFIGGGLFFHGGTAVVTKSVETISKVSGKVYPRQSRVRTPSANEYDIFTHPLGR